MNGKKEKITLSGVIQTYIKKLYQVTYVNHIAFRDALDIANWNLINRGVTYNFNGEEEKAADDVTRYEYIRGWGLANKVLDASEGIDLENTNGLKKSILSVPCRQKTGTPRTLVLRFNFQGHTGSILYGIAVVYAIFRKVRIYMVYITVILNGYK